ncbi:hypothetical protein AKJ09_03695 [Labilithrix luteola]|uniref:Uncharacterized protein n=2 Tax=Labilithrix luteola TaxID=1391654 RepID=A0A0K1PUI4_9BACT|nr:hypothetical protein AKJ09_03695 [Labilithrix luteola]
MSDVEVYELFGKMLDHAQPRIVSLCDEWCRDGKDIRELVIALGVKEDGGGCFVPMTRQEFADTAQGQPEGLQVLHGRRDMIPVAFCMVDIPALHLVWLNPISPEELN